MSSKHRPKTFDRTWLAYSLAAFNGSPYADHKSSRHFINSWIRKKEDGGEIKAVRAIVADYEWALGEASRFAPMEPYSDVNRQLDEELADKIARDV